MAHEISMTNGRPSIAYFGETPWHRLGIKLDAPATAQEAIVAAGLDYEATLQPIQTNLGTAVPQRRAVVRSDTGVVLGVVGNSYVPVQNQQAFSFLDNVVGDGSLRYHTAGALGIGERVLTDRCVAPVGRYWHVKADIFQIERIIPFYPFSRDRAKLSILLKTLALYRLTFGQPRQVELVDHLLTNIPESRIAEIRSKLMIDLSPILYQRPQNRA